MDNFILHRYSQDYDYMADDPNGEYVKYEDIKEFLPLGTEIYKQPVTIVLLDSYGDEIAKVYNSIKTFTPKVKLGVTLAKGLGLESIPDMLSGQIGRITYYADPDIFRSSLKRENASEILEMAVYWRDQIASWWVDYSFTFKFFLRARYGNELNFEFLSLDYSTKEGHFPPIKMPETLNLFSKYNSGIISSSSKG